MYSILTTVLLVLPYLLGSVATAVWVSRGLYGVDIRTRGSKNAGSTNMFRELGAMAGLLTQVVDVAKGSLAATLPWLVFWLAPGTDHFMADWSMEKQSLLCGLLAVIGHIYPVFAGFKGGKGINTLLGMMLVVNPLAALICLGMWFFMLIGFRFVSVASLMAVATYPGYIILRAQVQGVELEIGLLVLGLFMFGLVFFTHRANISRLSQGQEPKVSFK
jgi:glycerol-3-phosphate acyltransferase PlsY